MKYVLLVLFAGVLYTLSGLVNNNPLIVAYTSYLAFIPIPISTDIIAAIFLCLVLVVLFLFLKNETIPMSTVCIFIVILFAVYTAAIKFGYM